MFKSASEVFSLSLPTSFIRLTMPTGPERSFTPTAPPIRSPRLIYTMRTKSSELYQVFLSFAPSVASSAMPKWKP